jgi:hypothetical protein
LWLPEHALEIPIDYEQYFFVVGHSTANCILRASRVL